MPEKSVFAPSVSPLTCTQPPSTEVLAVPKNMKLLAIPLFELYDNSARQVHAASVNASMLILGLLDTDRSFQQFLTCFLGESVCSNFSAL